MGRVTVSWFPRIVRERRRKCSSTAKRRRNSRHPPKRLVPMRIPRSIPAALAGALLCSSFASSPVGAADTGPVKIAVITDMSGVYAALAGQGAVDATKMAVEDFGGKVLGRQIVVDTVDHRNQGPEAATKAREEFDSGAELALDMTNSGTALAVAGRGQGEAQARHRDRRRHLRADRRDLQQVHLPLCVRHLRAGALDRHQHRRAAAARSGTASSPTTRSANRCWPTSPTR